MSIKDQINRIKSNVEEVYDVLEEEQQSVTDTSSDYMAENMRDLYSNLKLQVLPDTVTINVDLDEYEIIDVTRISTAKIKDITVTTDGVYNTPEGYAGLGTVTVKHVAQGYLNDIRAALVELGFTPPADDSKIADYLRTSLNDILAQLEEINGEQIN